jgi:hypothetical protein
MHMPRKLLAAVVLTVPTVLFTTAGVAPSWAAPSAAAPGTITCTHVSGKVTFTPPLTLSGNSNTETTKTRTVFTHCHVSTGTAPTKGVTASTIIKTTTNMTANSCAALGASMPVTEKVVWTHTPTIANSTVKFSGDMGATEPTSMDAGFTLPNTGGTASVTGSYPGTDHGATSSSTVYTNMTGTAIGAACASATGLASLTLDAGTITLK